MIKNINANSHYVVVNNGYTSAPYISPGAQSAGMVRWNTNSNCFEIYDGVAWMAMNGGSCSIDLSDSVKQKLDYLDKLIEKDRKLNDLCARYPALNTAKENLDKAKDNLDILVKLVQDEQSA